MLGDGNFLTRAELGLLSWMSVVVVGVCEHGFVVVQMALVMEVVKRDETLYGLCPWYKLTASVNAMMAIPSDPSYVPRVIDRCHTANCATLVSKHSSKDTVSRP